MAIAKISIRQNAFHDLLNLLMLPDYPAFSFRSVALNEECRLKLVANLTYTAVQFYLHEPFSQPD